MNYICLAALVIFFDQLLKAYARTLHHTISLIPGILQLRYTLNTGMAFGLLSGNGWLLGLFSLLIALLISLFLRKTHPGKISMIGGSLLLGGAIGNAIDRLLFSSVTDMFQFTFFQFAVFNLADVAVCFGCAILAFTLLFCPNEWREK